MVPHRDYSIERMIKSVIQKGGIVNASISCAEGRGIRHVNLIEGVEFGTLSQLTAWSLDCDKVISF
jgi:uncharacterized protein involved in oxidation of intracellular sulfur